MGEVTRLSHPDADVYVEEMGNGERVVKIGRPWVPGLFISRRSQVTSCPIGLIAKVLEVKGPAWLCDEIARDEDPNYVEGMLAHAILAYLDPAEFAGKRLLDLGCGCGASTMVLARLFPETEIVGTELLEEQISVAKARAQYYGLHQLSFRLATNGERLPDGIGCFDFVVLNAVYEHLLSAERRTLIAQVWSHMRSGGVLFINETPNRYFPLEAHTTGLPLINYLPDSLAFVASRRFSKRLRAGESWDSLLRRGVRGGTCRDVVRNITGSADGKPLVLRPCRLGCRDQIDIWYTQPGGRIRGSVRKILKRVLKVVYAATGIVLTPSLSLAIKKIGGGSEGEPVASRQV